MIAVKASQQLRYVDSTATSDHPDRYPPAHQAANLVDDLTSTRRERVTSERKNDRSSNSSPRTIRSSSQSIWHFDFWDGMGNSARR
jgi:hypothetical protein